MARRALMPLVPLYRLALGMRELRLRTGLEPVRRLRRPVVSVGSLSAGGAGKTPMAIALARALTARGLHVDVLSRGYGRRGKAAIRVDPGGSAEDFGDEPLLIAREAGVPVYVAAQRYEAGLLAEAESGGVPVVHLLDDGFQHWQLHRDVNILLLDRDDLSSERLLPAGNLREPAASMRRADVVAIPSGDQAALLESELRARGWHGPVWRVKRCIEAPPFKQDAEKPVSQKGTGSSLKGTGSSPYITEAESTRALAPEGCFSPNSPDAPPSPAASPQARVAAFCGIARPGQFFAGLEAAGLRLVARTAFPDHHRYTVRDLDRVRTSAHAAAADAIVTTEKDYVRLGQLCAQLDKFLPLLTAKLRVEIEDEVSALKWLEDRIGVQP